MITTRIKQTIHSLTCDVIISLVYFLSMIALGCSSYSEPVLQTYCQLDTFSASCPTDHVIVMRSARYGRMRLGSCIKRDYGYIGCTAEVLTYMDSLCSGRTTCTLTVPDQALRKRAPCMELESYLEASYSCQPVLTGSQSLCRLEQQLAITDMNGTLSSQMAYSYEFGTRQCPWIITAKPGQKINITLIDFGMALRNSDQNGLNGLDPSICQKYATIRDITGSTGPYSLTSGHNSDSTPMAIVCGRDVRQRHVFISEGHQVQVDIMTRRGLAESSVPQFLFNFQVQGCANPSIPENMEYTRQDDVVYYSCIHGDRAWTQRCYGNAWIGSMLSCDDISDSQGVWQILYSDWSTPYGILVVASLGVILGIVIGVTLLVVALICIRRRRRDYEEKMLAESQMVPQNATEDGAYHQRMCSASRRQSSQSPNVKVQNTSEYQTYDTRATLSRQHSVPRNSCHGSLGGGVPVSVSMPRETGKTETVEIRPNPPPYCDRPTSDIHEGCLRTFKPREEQVYEFLN